MIGGGVGTVRMIGGGATGFSSGADCAAASKAIAEIDNMCTLSATGHGAQVAANQGEASGQPSYGSLPPAAPPPRGAAGTSPGIRDGHGLSVLFDRLPEHAEPARHIPRRAREGWRRP